MNWLAGTLGTSIGKKVMMALTGLAFCGFLLAHLAGNLTLYGGREAFNGYAHHLHSLGPLLTAAELGLLALALVHVATGLLLYWQNFRARPERYAVDARVRAGTWPEPPVFDLLRRAGHVAEDEMRAAFNLGIGLIAVVGGAGEPGLPIGEIVSGAGRVVWED